MPPTLSRRWLTRLIPRIAGPSAVAAAFLQEATVDWTTFTWTDIEMAYEHLIHYEPHRHAVPSPPFPFQPPRRCPMTEHLPSHT